MEVTLIPKEQIEIVQIIKSEAAIVQLASENSQVLEVTLIPKGTLIVEQIIKPAFSLTNTTATIPVKGDKGDKGDTGEQGVPGPAQEITQGELLELLTYIHQQNIPAATWAINHNLNSHPSVIVFDSAGDECEGQLTYTDLNNISIIFSAAFSGVAYLNA
jgi:hypothetical protein